MDQLNAEVYVVQGQIYRRNVPLKNITQTSCAVGAQLSNVYEEDEIVNDCFETAGLETKEDSDDEFKNHGKPSKDNVIKVECKQKSLIKTAGSTKMISPKRNNNPGKIKKNPEIQGEIAHKGRLEFELIKERIKYLPTHFVSICLANDANFANIYNNLIKMILNCTDIPEKCRNAKIYRPVEKLHLTLSVLHLLSEEDERIAKKCISDMFDRELREILSGETKIIAEFSGLSFFGKKKPNKVNVVYAKVVSKKLQNFANIIDKNLACLGLAKKRGTIDVVLHMTILNTKYAKNSSVKFIDARELMSRFGNFNFPPTEINEVRICKMCGVDPITNGYPTIFKANF